MRAPDDFTGAPNTCDSGVFTATATSLLIGHPEGVPRSLGQPRAWCVKAMRDCRPLWPVCRQETSPGWYGRFMGIPTVMVAVKAVSWNLMNRRENLSDFRMFVMAGAFSAAEDFVSSPTSHAKIKAPYGREVVTGAARPERRTKGVRTASSRRSAIVARPRASRLQSTCRCRSRSRSLSG